MELLDSMGIYKKIFLLLSYDSIIKILRHMYFDSSIQIVLHYILKDM